MSSDRRARTRARILDAARRLLAERGYRGTGMEEVARAAGVSRQAVYLHFGTKTDLLLALVRHVDAVEGLDEAMRRYRSAATPLEALDEAVAAVAAMEPRVYDVASVLYAARLEDPAAEAAWQDRMAGRRAEARALAAWLAREGLLAEGWSAGDASDFAWALLSPHTYEYLVVQCRWPLPRYVRHLRTTLRRTLVRAPEP